MRRGKTGTGKCLHLCKLAQGDSEGCTQTTRQHCLTPAWLYPPHSKASASFIQAFLYMPLPCLIILFIYFRYKTLQLWSAFNGLKEFPITTLPRSSPLIETRDGTAHTPCPGILATQLTLSHSCYLLIRVSRASHGSLSMYNSGIMNARVAGTAPCQSDQPLIAKTTRNSSLNYTFSPLSTYIFQDKK